MKARMTRRRVLAGLGAAGGSLAVRSALGGAAASLKADSKEASDPAGVSSTGRPAPWRYCLNAALVMGYRLDIVTQVELAAGCGYDAIEPWIRDIQTYEAGGGSLDDLKKRIADAGLTVESAIGFAAWLVDDDQRRAAGMEAMKRDMERVARIGGTRIAAPPAGVTGGAKLAPAVMAQRYRHLLEVGDRIGVVPQLEIWGPSRNLSRLGEALHVVAEAGHPKACLLPDFYHIYRGGSSFEGLRLLSPQAVHVFHMNDYPDVPRERIGDGDRVLPGRGVAPLPRVVRMMADNGLRPVWSIELFNRDYWSRYDPPALCRLALETMRAVTATAMA